MRPSTPVALNALRTLLLILLVITGSSSLATAPGTAMASAADIGLSPEIRRLLDLIEHRAQLMPDVARWKWHRGLPVTDPERELQVLAAGAATAAAAGLEAEGAAAFVSAQMAVSRSIQSAAFAGFETQSPAAGGPDLASDLRPAISATTRALLELLPRVLPLLTPAQAPIDARLTARLRPLGASSQSIAALSEALSGLRSASRPEASGRLDRILARGVLRIATTGDYAPFSTFDADSQRTGIDIDLARDLASTLGVQAEFVATSWPTLMQDLASLDVDIAMSGISRTLTRARSADFSAAYHVGGKTPIVRCADRARFTTLAHIDTVGVRVVVNPGGTNERFARSTLEHAELRVHDDNTTIFQEISSGRADAMFTDAIEVSLQSARDPRLCAALPGQTLTYQEKGLLLPRDADGAWLRYVDLWLTERIRSGQIDAVFERHLTATAPAPR